MSAKKKPVPKKVSRKKAFLLAKKQNAPSEELANNKLSTIKEMPQRACIDCHFLTRDIVDIDDNPDDERLNTARILERDYLLSFPREQIKKKEDDSDWWLGCWFEHWRGTDAIKKQDKYKIVLETERNDCPDFFEYRELRSFKSIEELLRKREERAPLGVAGQIKKSEAIGYDWSIKDTGDVFCNGQLIARLPNLQFKLFERLYKKSGKYVKNETLEKCWGDELPDYKETLPTTMSKLNAILEKGLKQNHIGIKSRVIEPKQERKKNVSYKLVT